MIVEHLLALRAKQPGPQPMTPGARWVAVALMVDGVPFLCLAGARDAESIEQAAGVQQLPAQA
jgi:hypothetical protein